MTELVLVFCMLATPGKCQEERPGLTDLSPVACLVQGQAYAQEWLADHPQWTLSGWRCEQNIPRHRET
jgi:hypothetical protein